MRMKQVAYAIAMIGVVGAAGLANAADEQKVQKIEITGSSIKRIAKEGALPVQTLKKEDIARTGATTVAELIQNMPAMQGFTPSTDSVGGGGGGLITASIHDIGEEYTLVLLNGRRIAPADSGGTVNLSSIPLSAVERVEVLTDGASALYGSDAIAGVVNFILKKNQQGFEIEGRYTAPQEKGGEKWSGGITAGFGDFESQNFNVLVSYSHDEEKLLKATDREVSKTGIIPFEYNGKSYIFFNGSPRGIPGNVDLEYTDAHGNSDTFAFNPYLEKNKACPSAHLKTLVGANQYQCYFDYASTVQIAPENKRDSVFATGRLKVSDNWVLNSDIAWSKYYMNARIAPQTANVPVEVGSALYNTYVLPYLPAAAKAPGATVDSVGVAYRVFDLGGRASKYTNESKHFVFGAEGDVAGWNMKAAFTHAQNNLSEDRIGGYVFQAPFVAAIRSGKVNPFVGIGEQSAEAMDLLNKALYKGPLSDTEVKYNGFDAHAQRELFEMAGGSAIMSFGGDFRTYDYKLVYDAASNGKILNENAQPNFDLSRQSMGLFSEVLLPLAENAELTASARYDSIDGVDDNLLGGKKVSQDNSKATYKLSGRYQPSKNLMLRASYGTGFKAPSMLDVARPLTDFGVTGSTYACPFADGDALKVYCKPGKQQVEVFRQGEATLRPEKSEQWTIGFRFEPTSSLTLGMDLWNVKIKDAVTTIDEQAIFNDPVRYRDRFTYKLNTATNRKDLAIIQKSMNIGQTHNQGIDWDTTFRARTEAARVTTSFSGTYLMKSKYTRADSNVFVTSLGQYGENDAVSFRVIANLATTIDIGDFSHTFTYKYRSGYKDKTHLAKDCAVVTPGDLDCAGIDIAIGVPSYSTLDFQTKYTPMKNVVVTAGVNNLLDNDPPRSLRNTGPHMLGYDPRYAQILGRTYYLSGSYKF